MLRGKIYAGGWEIKATGVIFFFVRMMRQSETSLCAYSG